MIRIPVMINVHGVFGGTTGVVDVVDVVGIVGVVGVVVVAAEGTNSTPFFSPVIAKIDNPGVSAEK